MINPQDVRDRIAAARNAGELKDAVHGVNPDTLKASFKLFKSVPPPDAVGTYPLEDQSGGYARRQPARAGDDSVMERIAGANGKGSSREDFPPAPRGENFQTAEGELVSPPETYEIEEDVTFKLPGGMRLLSPVASGVPDAAGFVAPQPGPVHKSAGTLASNIRTGPVSKRRGVFTDVVMAPIAGSNFMDAPRVSKSEDEMDEPGAFGAGVVEYGD